MRILSVDQIYNADRITEERMGISSNQLMEQAGARVSDWIMKVVENLDLEIMIFCGVGNNGGDGLVVARHLIEAGYEKVNVYVVNFSDKRSKDFLINYERIRKITKNWPATIKSEKDFPKIEAGALVIDAIFGIGLNQSPKGWVKGLIQHLNNNADDIVSVDIPSGLFAEKPLEDVDAVIKATVVLTFQVPKMAFFLPQTGVFAEKFNILPIGLDEDFIDSQTPLAYFIDEEFVRPLYRPRNNFTYKGTYGHALIVAGSYGKIGAAVLATRAAFKTGAGMLTTFIPQCGYDILQMSIPEAMVATDKHQNHITRVDIDFEPSAIGIGMGMGTNQETAEALKSLFKTTKAPLVIDADALNIISVQKDIRKQIPRKSILTPHPGELRRLIGNWENDYQKLEMVKKFSKKHDVIVVVKGRYTITVYENTLYVNNSGNPGMGTAGSGDALTGIITGMLSQGFDSLNAAIFGVFLHGKAGDIASEMKGFEAILAGDIIENLSKAYLDVFYTYDHPLRDEEYL